MEKFLILKKTDAKCNNRCSKVGKFFINFVQNVDTIGKELYNIYVR